jgi:hypothetical protein
MQIYCNFNKPTGVVGVVMMMMCNIVIGVTNVFGVEFGHNNDGDEKEYQVRQCEEQRDALIKGVRKNRVCSFL